MTTETTDANGVTGTPDGASDDFSTFQAAANAEPAGDGADDDDQPGDDAAASEGQGEQPKPKKTAQDRIDEVTAARRQAERDAKEAREEAERWRALAEQRAATSQTPQTPQGSDGKPNPEDFQDGVYDPAYVEALTDWKADQAVSKRLSERDQVRTQQTALTAFNARAAEAFPDGEPDGLKALKAIPQLSQTVALTILDMDDGPKVADHLGANRAELSRIESLPPHMQVLELAKISTRLASAPAAPAANKIPGAPEPPDNRVRGSGGQFKTPPDTSDFAAFEKMAGAG
jgi:hypothetical protein